MRLTVTWPADYEHEMDGDMVNLGRAVGVQRQDLAEMHAEGRFSADIGSIGRGAAASGVALVLEIAERVINDLGGLIAVGEALRWAIKYVSERRKRAPAAASSDALAALAAYHVRDSLPVEARYVKTVLLNGDPGMGTDERDVWAVCFAEDFQQAHVVFLSPTGLALGYVRVPTERYFKGGELKTRSEQDIAAWWQP